MGMIDGSELLHCNKIPHPQKVLDEILLNMRKDYIARDNELLTRDVEHITGFFSRKIGTTMTTKDVLAPAFT